MLTVAKIVIAGANMHSHLVYRKFVALVIILFVGFGFPANEAIGVEGWLDWRGPRQNGTSDETGLPDVAEVDGENHLWSYELAGRGTPVIAGDRLYTLGYHGEGPDLQEVIVCLNAETGKKIWEHGFNDFLSDIVYDRYAIGSPTVDPDSGRVYMMTTPGIFACFTPDGDLLWRHSMMEEFGRLTFPNGRTGAPVIDDDLVIVRGITSNWGAEGPARDRFYAFDKESGQLVWSSTPGVGPKDSSFSTPLLQWKNGNRVFYCGTGCGNVVCVNARSGDPVWRFQFSRGGVNSSVVLHGEDRLIAIHGKENVDTSDTGRMIALQLGAEPGPDQERPLVLDSSAEIWRNGLGIFTSSPVIVGDRIYQTVHEGDLCCVDANSGKILWKEKLSTDQLHASPLFADGKLYVPYQEGKFFIVRPSDAGPEILSEVKLEGSCLGSPSVWNGRIYVHTTQRLYCFGTNGGRSASTSSQAAEKGPSAGEPAELQAVPAEVLMRPGESVDFSIRALDRNGLFVSEIEGAEWSKFIPPTAKVKSEMDADFVNGRTLSAADDAQLSAGAFQAKKGDLKGTIRGRILPNLPITEDFEGFELSVPREEDSGKKFAFPPLPWIGARFKWEIRDLEGNHVLVKTLDNVLFQRAITFIGHPDENNYTVEADVMTDGNRRMKSNVGVINQRYFIALIGNTQQIEVSSNYSRLQVGVPYKWSPGDWHRLKTRVDTNEDGSGVVRAKAWPEGEQEPEEWTIEVHHKKAHPNGAPGIFGFSPQSRFSVYVDNVVVKPNE